MAAAASSSRINASDLNGPIDHAPPTADLTHEDRRERRASPSYDAAAAAARQQNNGSNSNWRRLTPERALGRHDDGYQGRPDRQQQQYETRPQRNNYGGNRGGGGNADFLASRQAERDASSFSIWPPSPKTPRDEGSDDERERRKRKKDKKHKSSKSSHHKKKRYSSETESDSDDDDKHHKSKKHRSSKHRRSEELSDSEYERERRRRKEKKEKKRSSRHRDDSRSRSRSRTVERIYNDQEDEWAEKGASGSDRAVAGTSLVPSTAGADRSGLTSSKGKGKETGEGNISDSDSDDVGPKPLPEAGQKANPKDYGGALLRGEGAAMAAFVAEGQRIPRRGEIGLESDQIAKYEDVGYVMSGSRHRRMNAVRMRKENQVITADEKRQLLKTQKEEQDKKETMVVSSFKELLEQRLQGEKRKQRDDY